MAPIVAAKQGFYSSLRSYGRALILACLCASGLALAEPAGQVTNLSGPLFAIDTAGTRRILSVGSKIEPGETLVTEEKTYAQLRFIDKSVVTLKPGTQFKVESFVFDEKAPEQDNASFGLLKGALRTITGLVGKRGNQDAYRMNTATATIGIRGTHFMVQYVPDEETAVSLVPYALPLLARMDLSWDTDTLTDVPAGLFDVTALQLAQAPPGGLAPGTYAHVFEGAIGMGPPITAAPPPPGAPPPAILPVIPGQTGFAAKPPTPTAPPPPPKIIPTPPSMVPSFTPPATFQVTQSQAQQAPAGQPAPPPPPAATQKQDSGGCEVR